MIRAIAHVKDITMPVPREKETKSKLGAGRVGRVFISYKREEMPAARRSYDYLRGHGFDVFWDDDIQCGQQWNKLLDEELSSAACVVVLWTPLAMTSQWVKHEASVAIARGTYAPAWLELCKLEPPYGDAQAKDISGWDGISELPGLNALVDRICALVPVQEHLAVRILNWCRSNISLIVAVLFSAIAFCLLAWQTVTVRGQLTQLESVSRMIDRVDTTKMSANVFLTFDLNDKAFTGYRERLLEGFEARKRALLKSGEELYDDDQTSLLDMRKTNSFRFTVRGVKLRPNRTTEVEVQADRLLNAITLVFHVDRKRTEADFVTQGSVPIALDVFGSIVSWDDFMPPEWRESTLIFDSGANTISVNVEGIPVRSEAYNPGFLSRHDFVGAELVAPLTGSAVPKSVSVKFEFSEGGDIQSVKGCRVYKLSDGSFEFRGKLGRHFYLDPDSPPID